MSNASIERWPGCHGVRIRDTALDIGATSGHPLADVTVRVATLPDPIPEELWRIHGEATTGRVKREIDRWLCRHPGGQFVVHASAGPGVAFDSGPLTATGGTPTRPAWPPPSAPARATSGAPSLRTPTRAWRPCSRPSKR